MLLCKLKSKNIALHVISSETWTALKRSQKWVKKIANSAQIKHWSFVILMHDVCITLNINNQKTIIKKLMKNNTKFHDDLKMLRIIWLKKIIESKKIHSSLIIKIMIKMMINQLLNISMLNLYQKYLCKLFKKTIISRSATIASISIIWLNFAKMKNAALNAQTSITLKNALH